MESLTIPRSANFSCNMDVTQTFVASKNNNLARLCEFKNRLPPIIWKIQLVIISFIFFRLVNCVVVCWWTQVWNMATCKCITSFFACFLILGTFWNFKIKSFYYYIYHPNMIFGDNSIGSVKKLDYYFCWVCWSLYVCPKCVSSGCSGRL